LKALEVACAIKNDERKSKCKIFYPIDDENAAKVFWSMLSGTAAQVDAAHPDTGAGISEEA